MMQNLFRNEDGVALPVAAGVLLVLSLLIVALASNAMQATSSANKDRNSKRALGAAEAGLQVANNRLNEVRASGNRCFTYEPVLIPASGECPPVEVDLGNGAKTTYHVTPALEDGDACGSVPGALASGVERCITATGEVNGVKRRVQTRVLTTPISPPLLQVDGMTGLKRIDIGNNAESGGNLGTNGEIVIGNNGVVPQIELGPRARIRANKLETEFDPKVHLEDFTLREPPIEGTQFPCEEGVVMQGCNNNIALASYPGYDEDTRDLRITQNLVLPSGDYNFCRLEFAGGGLRAEPGATVRIFVDGPEHSDGRPGSMCMNYGGDPQWGGVDGKNGISIGQPNDLPEAIELYVYGWPSDSNYAKDWGRSMIQVGKNDLAANAFIYAPQSYVYVAKNSAIVNGAVAAEEVYIKNSLQFNWDDDLRWVGFSSGRYDRQGWRECKSEPTVPSDPESGC